MKIVVNNSETEIPENTTVSQLLESRSLPRTGIAVGINGKIVPKSEWETCRLSENDSLIVIRAACGG